MSKKEKNSPPWRPVVYMRSEATDFEGLQLDRDLLLVHLADSEITAAVVVVDWGDEDSLLDEIKELARNYIDNGSADSLLVIKPGKTGFACSFVKPGLLHDLLDKMGLQE